MVDETGGMLNDPVLLKLAENRYWISIADSDLLYWVKGLAYGLHWEVDVIEPDVSPLAVQGPKAEELMERVFGEQVRDIRFFRFAPLEVDGNSYFVARSGYSKQGGFEIYVHDSALGEPLWDRLMEAGTDLNVRAGGPNMIERIEGGLLSYGSDMTRQNTPHECGLGRFCDTVTAIGCIGRDALLRVASEGPVRQIRGLLIDGEPVPACTDPWAIHGDEDGEDEIVGRVTSAAWSPDMGTNVGIGMVRMTHWKPGTRSGSTPRPARVTRRSRPFRFSETGHCSIRPSRSPTIAAQHGCAVAGTPIIACKLPVVSICRRNCAEDRLSLPSRAAMVLETRSLLSIRLKLLSYRAPSGAAYFLPEPPHGMTFSQDLLKIPRAATFSIALASLISNLMATALPIGILIVYDRVLPNASDQTLALLRLGILAAVGIDVLVRMARGVIVRHRAARYGHRAYLGGIEQVLSADPRVFQSDSVAVHLDRLNAVDAIRESRAGYLPQVLVDFPFFVIFVGLVFAIGGQLGWVLLAFVGATGLMAVTAGLSVRDRLEARQNNASAQTNFLIEALEGMQTIKSYAMESLTPAPRTGDGIRSSPPHP